MGGFLDIPTLLVTAAVASFCISVSLILTWSSSRRELCTLSWGATFGLAVVAMTLIALRGRLDPRLSVIAADAVLLAAFGVLWLGYRQFTGVAGRYDVVIACLGTCVWLLIWVSTSLLDDINIRQRMLSGIEFVYFLFIVARLIRHYPHEPLPSVGLTTVLVGAHAAVQLYRIVWSFTKPFDAATITLPNSLYMGIGLIVSSSFLVSLGLLQLVLIGQRSERRYRMAAESDGLTGLANRRHFLDQILPSLASGDGHGALVLFDIDNFKTVNDTHGHPAGDRALVAFAETLAAATPPAGLVARIGGEEFALYLPEASTAAAAELADGIRRRAAELRIAAGTGVASLTVSCGVAGISEAGADFQTLHAAADEALYAAKSAGRDQVAVYHPTVPALLASGSAPLVAG